jgi:perosamine synthetase
MGWKIPLFKIYWDKEDVKAVTKAIKSGMNWAVGPNIRHFEEMIESYLGVKYALTFNSGTSALHATMIAYDIKEGDEIIVPSFTFIATANTPLFVGAKPVFADIEEDTFGLDPEDVKKKISKKTKAIIPIHYGGCPCKIRELREIAQDNNLLLIEDAAESLGAKIFDKKIATFGDSAILSFCQNKIMTTGEGGAVLTNSKEIYEKLKLIMSHGRLETQNYFSSIEFMDYITLGYNFRMSNITAALGITQLGKINKIIEMRRKKAEYLNSRLEKEEEIETPAPPKGYYHVYQLYTIKTENRDGLMKYLAKKSIMTKIYFSPVHLTHFYREKLGYSCELPVTENTSKQVLTLPMYPVLKKEEMDQIVDEIKKFKGGNMK